MRNRVELFADIRRDARVEELGIRALARKYGMGRGTVRQALASASPPERKTPVRSAPKLDPYKPTIDDMLRLDLDAPRKQRHTATRIHHRLLDEHGADVSYGSVRDYVRARRVQIEIEAVPRLQIKYDNLTAAVKRVLIGEGRGRVENDRWVLFRSHYGFDPFYCLPGVDGAHEKGGVEGDVGRFRRTWLSPMPVTDSLDELNDRLRSWDARDENRRITGKTTTVAADFAADQAAVAPLPADRFDPGLVLHPRVDRSSMITIRMARYSVPSRLIGRQVRPKRRPRPSTKPVAGSGSPLSGQSSRKRPVPRSRSNSPTKGSSRSCCSPNAMTGTGGPRSAASPVPDSPARNGWATSTTTRTRT